MTGIDRANPVSPAEAAKIPVANGGSIKRFQLPHERSLAEMLAIADWRSFVPETIALLAIISLIRVAIINSSNEISGMPHPFWIPVLLMSSQYGVMGGLFATVSAVGLFFISGLPPQSAIQDFYAYAGIVAAQPAAWFGTALILGGLRSLHIHHQTEIQEQLDQTKLAAEELADGLKHAVGEIERLERRIATDASTLTSFTHSLGKLELSDRRTMIAGTADLIRHGVGATSFAIYLKNARGFVPVLGIDNGSNVPPGTIAPLATTIVDEICGGAKPGGTVPNVNAYEPARISYRAPIRLAGTNELIGVVVCNRLQPLQDPIIAACRLDDVCRALAMLLSVVPDAGRGLADED